MIENMTEAEAVASGRWMVAGAYQLPEEEWMLDNCIRDQIKAKAWPVIVNATVDGIKGATVWILPK